MTQKLSLKFQLKLVASTKTQLVLLVANSLNNTYGDDTVQRLVSKIFFCYVTLVAHSFYYHAYMILSPGVGYIC